MEFPNSFTRDLAAMLRLNFNKLGTDSLIGLTTLRYQQVLDGIAEFIEITQTEWDDPIEVDNEYSKTIFDHEVTYLYLMCADQDDAWELIIAESDVGTLVSANRL